METLREGRRVVEASCGAGGRYHSGAARETGTGAPVTALTSDGEGRKQGGTVELTASPLNCIRGGAFCFAPNRTVCVGAHIVRPPAPPSNL